MELSELVARAKEIFSISDISEMPDAMLDCALRGDNEVMRTFVASIPDLSNDWAQKIFQYYLADRGELNQDFTPQSIASLVSRLTISESVVDLCSGSGALTIARWNENKNQHFVCVEKDKQAFSVLLFNLAIRNMSATVYNADALSLEYDVVYKLRPSESYSTVAIEERSPDNNLFKLKCESGISNPPYNIKWDIPDFAPMQERFFLGVPPKQNANYAFALTLLSMTKRCALILPNGVLTSGKKEELAIRQSLLESNILDTVISLPEKMFESTSIPVCILVFDTCKETRTVEMIDARGIAETEEREQKGQFGGSSHTNRVYKKEINTLSDDSIQRIIDASINRENKTGFSISVQQDVIARNDFNFSPQRYVEMDLSDELTRSLEDIACDINRCAEYKNSVKLTINETLARSLGLYDIMELQNQSINLTETMNDSMPFIKTKLIKSNFIKFTKNKNELTFSNNSKDTVAGILLLIINSWKEVIYNSNNEENIFLAELRDTLLPMLMSGEIDLCNINGKEN